MTIRKSKLKAKKNLPEASQGGVFDPGGAVTALSLIGALMSPVAEANNDMSSDNLHTVLSGDFRGNFMENTGVFRPDQMGAFSPEGNSRGKYYAEGGSYFGGDLEIPMASPMMLTDASNFTMTDQDYLPTPTVETVKADQVDIPVSQAAEFSYKYLMDQHGLPSHVAAGIVGNIQQESQFITTRVEEGNTRNGRGIAQWDVRNRWQNFLKYAKETGRDATDLRAQLDFLVIEPGEGQRAIKEAMKASTAEEASLIWGRKYERPNEKHANWKGRAAFAAKFHKAPVVRRPQANVHMPLPFKVGEYEEGGEYDMDPVELLAFMANGGQVEFL